MTVDLRQLLLFAMLMISGISLSFGQFWSNKQPDLLPEQQAFSATASIINNKLIVNWSIADGYYIYRDSLKIEALTADTKLGAINFPAGVIENDPEFGEVEVYFYNIELSAELLSAANSKRQIDIKLYGQGCNKPVGVCYPPMQRILNIADNRTVLNSDDPSDNVAQSTDSNQPPVRDTNSAPNTDKPVEKSLLAYVLAAFGAGILLSFTPCVLPMIPILAGVIAGQQNPSKLQSGWLAICYVAGTVVTYIIAGALAGATGSQLQAYFQNIWVIGFICCLLAVLAASLFGCFKIQLPSSLQTKLNDAGLTNRSASLSSFALGLVSALVVGACVSPVLILALGAAITQGDPVLGAAIMGAMAIGMGLLLILFGFGAGWILPKAGAWMNQVQIVFGLMVLGVAIYLLDSLGLFPTLYFWTALLLITGVYFWQIASNVQTPLLNSVWRAVGIAFITWGVMSLVGASIGSNNVMQPLEKLSRQQSTSQSDSSLAFIHTTQLQEVTTHLQQAKQSGQPVFIDFYADWCLDCKRMQRTTYKKNSVINALKDWRVIEIDVTDTNSNSEEVKRYFNVFGPPASLFIAPDGSEHQELRQYGYLNETDFLSLINQANAKL